MRKTEDAARFGISRSIGVGARLRAEPSVAADSGGSLVARGVLCRRLPLPLNWIVRLVLAIVLVQAVMASRETSAQVLDKQKQLDAQTFWDNRDWDWYVEQIPFFECPDADITTTYYYRWELLTKHLTYGSPNSGYSFTEFIDRPFWSGAYGAISFPAGHQLYEARWLRQPRIARDYLKYWFRTPGAQPRNYSTWLADSAWAVNQVHRGQSRSGVSEVLIWND